MRLKTTNKLEFPGLFLICISGLVIVLSFFTSTKKDGKYPDAPNIEQKTTLDFIQISLNEKHYNKLKKKRDKALSLGVLETSDKDYVPATIVFNGQKYKADIRLKGDWTDHLKGDKWSFRVKLKDDKTIMGMRKFSIHHPGTRAYVNEWLFHKAIKREGLIGLRYEFLEGVIHIKKKNSPQFINKKVGIYAIEESFDKRTLESNKRKESIILKYSEDIRWDEVIKAKAVASPSGLRFADFTLGSRTPITLFSEANVLKDSSMLDYFRLGKHLLLNSGKSIALSDAFEVKKLAMNNALLNLFGATHGNEIINLRFYYNPLTSKLEPIAFDGNSGQRLKSYDHFYIVKYTKMDSIYKKELAVAMEKVSKPGYLNDIINAHKKEITNYESVIKREFKVRSLYVDNLRHNQTIIKEELLRINPGYTEAAGASDISIKTFSLPEVARWNKKDISVERNKTKRQGNNIYRISRNNIQSYTATSFNKVNTQGKYKISIIVKKGKTGSLFGLKLQGGLFKNKADAVFDLDKGKLVGFVEEDGFRSGCATIQDKGDGWYICSLMTEVNDANLRVVMGPTEGSAKIPAWENGTNKVLDIYLDPSSLIFEEVF